MNPTTQFKALCTVDTDKIIPFAKEYGWTETIPNPIQDDMNNLTIPNPVPAIDFADGVFVKIVAGVFTPFIEKQIDLQAQVTLDAIQASKEAEIKRLTDSIIISHS
jgi:hypothetical protein